jgi:hypothetical protein
MWVIFLPTIQHLQQQQQQQQQQQELGAALLEFVVYFL